MNEYVLILHVHTDMSMSLSQNIITNEYVIIISLNHKIATSKLLYIINVTK